MKTILVATDEFHVELACSRGTMSDMHNHGGYEMYYILNGERDYFIEDKFYKVSEREAVLIPPTLLHRTAGKMSRRILIYFNEAFLRRYFSEEIIKTLSLGEPFVFRAGESTNALHHSFEELYREFQRGESEKDEPKLASRLFNILFLMSNDENCYKKMGYEDARMESILRFINENYANIDGLEELSGHFFISKYHFCRMFKKNLGVSVTSYVNAIKIRSACRLLSSEGLSLTDAAVRSGFNSLSYFSKVFKSETGMSPSEYKKICSQKHAKQI